MAMWDERNCDVIYVKRPHKFLHTVRMLRETGSSFIQYERFMKLAVGHGGVIVISIALQNLTG